MYPESEKKSTRFDPSSIDVEKKNMSVSSLITMLQNDMIDLSPAFQREKDLWKPNRQSQLIESLMLKLPLPSMYFEYNKRTKKYIVIDGLQRLCTLKNFAVNKTLALRDLEFLPDQYDGATYDSLTFNDQIEFGLQEIVVNILKGTTPDEAKYAIFKRINSAATTLNNQEIRNALYNGKGTRLLSELATDSEFKKIGFPTARMDDREAILRFMAFKINGPSKYSGRMDTFLTNTLIELNKTSEDKLEILKAEFQTGVSKCIELLGIEAFRLPGNKKHRPSKALFDTLAVNVAELTPGQYSRLIGKIDVLRRRFKQMLANDKELLEAVGNKSDRAVSASIRYVAFKNLCLNTIENDF